MINTSELQQAGLDAEIVKQYREAVEAAWREVEPFVGHRAMVSVHLALQDPARDRSTVCASFGFGGSAAPSVCAQDPEGLRRGVSEALLAFYRTRD